MRSRNLKNLTQLNTKTEENEAQNDRIFHGIVFVVEILVFG
jgi:hypothetical protein